MWRRSRILIACVLVSVPLATVAAMSDGRGTHPTAARTLNARPSPTLVELSRTGHREGSVAHALGFTRLPGSFFFFLTCVIAAYLVLIELAKSRFYSSQRKTTHREYLTSQAR